MQLRAMASPKIIDMDEAPGELRAPMMAELAEWQQRWSAKLDEVGTGARALTLTEARAGLLRGTELLLPEGGLVAQWRDGLDDPRPEQARAGLALAEGVHVLFGLMSSLLSTRVSGLHPILGR